MGRLRVIRGVGAFSFFILGFGLGWLPVGGAPASLEEKAAAAAFLDRPVSMPKADSGLPETVFEPLQSATGQRVIPSAEFRRWMEIGNPSMHFFLQPARYPSVRKYLDKICPLMEVKWEYDAESNAIRVDFGWRHSDARSSSELLAFLREHRPAPADSQIFKPHPTDPWDVAFNALLSKEENFPQVWELRARADAEVPFLVAMDTENLCVGILRDRQGRPHTLILNNQPMMVSPGAGSASYYLFDAQGRFEQGGIFNTGHRVLSVSAWLNQEGTRLTLEGWFNGSSSLTNTFELSDWGLVETSEFDASGVPLPAWEHSGYHLGDRIYTATAAPGGLTKEEVIQNAWSLFIRNTNNPVDRAEIVDHQLELSREQEDFLFTFWDDMGGKDFLPLVRRAAAVPEGNGKALAILEGIDPEAARPLILEDIGRENRSISTRGRIPGLPWFPGFPCRGRPCRSWMLYFERG